MVKSLGTPRSSALSEREAGVFATQMGRSLQAQVFDPRRLSRAFGVVLDAGGAVHFGGDRLDLVGDGDVERVEGLEVGRPVAGHLYHGVGQLFGAGASRLKASQTAEGTPRRSHSS